MLLLLGYWSLSADARSNYCSKPWHGLVGILRRVSAYHGVFRISVDEMKKCREFALSSQMHVRQNSNKRVVKRIFVVGLHGS